MQHHEKKNGLKSPRSTTVEVALDATQLAQLQQLADECGITVQQVAQQLASEALAQRVRRKVMKGVGR